MLYNKTYEEAARFIKTRKPGDTFDVIFAGRGVRRAQCTRLSRTGRPVIRTWVTANEKWSEERPLEIQDILTKDQISDALFNRRAG